MDIGNSCHVRSATPGRSAIQSVVSCPAPVQTAAYKNSMEYYGPRYKLEVLANNADDHNPPEYLEKIK